jgi:uncharacterized protein (DUF1501 family)
MTLILKRRTALLGLASAITFGGSSFAFAQAETHKRLVVVLLRGAMDGLAAVVPYGDPNLRNWRSAIVTPEPGSEQGLLDLGGFWGLHPALPNLHALYKAGAMLPVHAVAMPKRTRSHFDGQDLLECGTEERLDSGWLNRLAALLPAGGPSDNAVALGENVPLLLRGPVHVSSWSPGAKPTPSTEFYSRLRAIHSTDPLTGPALDDGFREREFNMHATSAPTDGKGNHPFVVLARTAGQLLGKSDGPRLAALQLDGWDTHAFQVFRLGFSFKPLDDGMAALRDALGPAWSDTVVLIVTEFGRTVRVNGNGGTDHGTGTVAFVLGGAVNGGRVQVDWPGLGESQLFENRDLNPTTDLRSVTKAIVGPHFGLKPEALDRLFPDSAHAEPIAGLLRV